MSYGHQRQNGPLMSSWTPEEDDDEDDGEPSTSAAGGSLEVLKDEVVQLIESFPNGVEVSRLTIMYRRVYGKRFGPLSSYSLSGLQELLDQIRDQVYVERIYNKNLIRSVNSPRNRRAHGLNMDDAPKRAICQNVVKTVKKHPHGIPLNKLAEVFAFRYKQTLSPEELGFSSMEAFVGSLSKDLLLEDGVVFHKKTKLLTGEDFDKKCREIVELVKSYPQGIPLCKIASFYHTAYGKILRKKELGFSSIADFIHSLTQELYVENEQIYYKSADPEAAAPKAPLHIDGVFKDVIELVEDHPEGVPIRKLSNFFSQRYRKNLTVLDVGFESIADFTDFLSDELLVEKEKIFHKKHRNASANPTTHPVTTKCSDAPVVLFGADSAGDVEMKQEDLMGKVKEVIKKCPAASRSIAELQKGYRLLFGSELPIKQYMALYDNHTAKRASSTRPDVGAKSTKKAPEKMSEDEKKPLSIVNDQVVRSKAGSPLLQFSGGTAPVMATPGNLSATDFPVFGSKLSKADKLKLKEGRGPVFSESYYSQVREVHGANVRAMEALLDNEENAGKRRKNVNANDVNCLIEDVLRALSAEGEHVTIERVISRVCSLLQVCSLRDINIDPRRHLPALQDLQRTLKEINLYIESVETVSSVCTLYELGQALANLKNKKRFEELHLGPLCKIPLIHRMFRIDANTKDDDVHQISTVDILRSLRMYRRINKVPRVDLAEFLKHLADQYSCESPYELGIRIQSLGLPISTLNKASAADYLHIEKAKETIQREIQEEVEAKMYKIKKNLMDPAQGAVIFSHIGNAELRKKYASMTATDAVLEVFINSEGVFSKSMTKTIQTFLSCINRDRLARALFQLAICCGSLDAPQDLVAKEKPQKKAEKKTEETPAEMLPTEDDVKRCFQESVCNSKSTLTLVHLRTLEKRIAEHFRFRDFSQLQQGTFLDFIIKNKKVLQEAAGGAVCIDSQDPGLSGFRPCRQDVFEFIKQCGDGDDSRVPFIEAALRNHYRIRDSRELGHGPLSFLLNCTQRQKELSGDALASAVRYECPLLPVTTGVCVSEPAVGLLGEVGRDQAMAALLSAPLLHDLQDWTQWQLVFLPNHGPLKDFIDKYCGKTELLALEVSPGVLLRVTSKTGDKHFSDAAQALDPLRTAGHLVSMAVADGIPNTPTALLANHMESALNVGVAQEEISPGDDGYSYSTVAQFVLECLTLIPTRICKELLQQVFLEPLSKVLGQAKSKAVLLDAAQTNTRYLNKLHQMGLLLGITEWRADFNKKLLQSPPAAAAADAVLQEKKVVLEDSMSDFSSVQSLNDVDNEEETALSTSSSRANQQDSGDDDGDDDDDEEEEEEQMYKLVSEDEDTDSSEEDREELSDEPQEEEKEEEEEEKPNPQRAVIEDIRKTEFGIGVELNQEGQILMEKQQARLGRSLQRLSDELYSKDTHFVLELIQNADDNSYPDGGEQPALTFVVEKSCVTILNNECGFEEKNIRAVCDVGRSTKGKHKYGYIGQKGIGFKSVFKVTDCPEIHSNGFHIQFDKTSGPMGYILPHWLEQERPVNPAAKEIAEKRWTTKIHLPLRTENYQTKNLFHDVHPSLLLFLHRLRSITIFNEAEKRLVSMTRRDLSHNILEVSHTGGEERWLVLKKMLFPKKIKDDVESTELALAFQIRSSSCADVKPQKQPVFAFLPLRSFGFRFIIQGDFDIPSSREDVDRDSSWNQWLRSEIPQLFVQAMDVFSKHPEFSGLSGLCYFLQFIPQPSEILDFFNPVANQIIQLLRGRACLPAQEDHEGRVEFRQPSQLAVCSDRLIQQVIGGQDLSRSLSLWYLHPDLQCSVSGSLLSALGVHRLRAAEILTVICCMARELLQHTQTHTDGELEKLARLLVCIFRALELEYEVDALLQSVRDVPMIPLADGSVVSLSSQGVFFPLDDMTQAHADLQALYQDLNTVDQRLLQSLDALGNSQVRELLRRLDVHELEPQQVLDQHIYPQLRSGDWQKKPQGIVVSYLVFIKLHAQDQEIRSLAAHIPVLTNQGFRCPAEHKIHFSKDYKNIHLPSVLPGVQWLLLDSCYLRADADVSGWRSVFTALGVRDLLIFRKEKRTFTTAQLSCSPWATESTLWPTPADGQYTIMDHQCSELHTLLTSDQLSDQEKLQQRRALIHLLDTNWNSGERYGQLVSAQLLDADGGVLRNVRSSFIHILTEFSWIPAHRPMCSTVSYLQPRNVYIFSTAVNRLLGAHVDYMHSEQTASEFTTAIGLRHSVCVEDMVGYLKRWCVKESEEPSEEPEGADFSSTIDHIHALYSYLFNECSSGQLRDLFQRWPAVYIEYNRDGDWSSGRFYHLKEVCWCDPTGMFQRYRELIRRSDSGVQEPRVLSPLYSTLQDMKSMFKALSVEPNPSMKQYVCLLEAVCESAPLATGDVLQDVSVIFAKLADKCKVCVHGEQEQLNPTYCSSLREMVSHKRVFPTKTSGWVTLSRKPMIADNVHLEKIFKSHTSVCLLNLPSVAKKTANKYTREGKHDKEAFSEHDRELFLQICGIERLSQRVTTEPQTESYRPCPAVQTLVRQLVPFIQRFILHHSDFEEAYGELKDSGIAQRISALSFGQVGKLYIHYRLELPDESPIFESEDIICLLKDQKELYIHKDHLSARLDICRELVKLFTADKMFAKELERFLQGLVTCINDGAALKRFLDRENAQKLPENEEAWDVPAPVVVKAEPVVVRPSASSQQDTVQPEQNKEDRLVCWPPRASLHRTGGSSSVSGSQAVDEVMKIWPPPPPPAQCVSGSEFSSSSSSLHPHAADPPAEVKVQQEHTIKSSTAPHTERREEVSVRDVQPVVSPQKPAEPNTDSDEQQNPKTEEEISITQTTEEEKQIRTAGDRHTHQHSAPQVPAAAPELVLSQFQGAESVQRPSISLDSAVWSRTVCAEEVLEDLPLNFSLPDTLLLPRDGQMTEDAASIGQWGEQLVFSFLQHWQSSGSGPSEITWFNQSGESGRACDFKLSFSDQEILVEVKTTVRRDRHFIRMSANELDLALKEKERYHIYRVYGAGDAQHVRLCRIRNLAQHLHSKSLELFLFV
ncbi:uncharacterized protein wu:fj29h11 isoform X1 [Danio aesculapii]|uniref:uncharacterized protein wu:fj29h11 isoform X1 n=2 Tax=Danio aesculapii TaxID=1142201 RepID=UPI0024BF5E0A|nr:uncharacterized protein wu:fj29h11 isoform X1 [Danio aesculapii]